MQIKVNKRIEQVWWYSYYQKSEIKLIDRQNKPPGFQQEGPIHQHKT